LFVTIACEIARKLDISVEMPEPHDFAVRFHAHSSLRE
jgi:hypothetical protein